MMRKKDDYRIRQRDDNLFEVEIKGERQSHLLSSANEAKALCNKMLEKLANDDLEDSDPLTPQERKEIEVKQNKQLILNTIRKINE